MDFIIIAVIVLSIAVGVTLGLRALGDALERMSERDE